MSTVWLKELFGVEKPIIAMAHLPALPGTPMYDADGGVDHLCDAVQADVEHLENGGVDGIMFCNEDDRPYVFQAGIEQIATMSRVVADCKPRGIPFGVDFLWDGMAAVAIAHATGASFMREVLTGVYESDMGLWAPNAGKVARFRRQIDAGNVRMFYNVVPEFASPLGARQFTERARSAVVSSMADVILVSGSMAGEEPDVTVLREIKETLPDVPVFLNTGAKPNNIKQFLEYADGALVGSSLKVDGYTWNPVDPERVEGFMNEVAKVRQPVF